MEQILFGERLRNAREASGLSRDAMASRVGVSTETVEKWECGKAKPRANRLQTLVSLLNLPLLWLLAGSQQVPAARPKFRRGNCCCRRSTNSAAVSIC